MVIEAGSLSGFAVDRHALILQFHAATLLEARDQARLPKGCVMTMSAGRRKFEPSPARLTSPAFRRILCFSHADKRDTHQSWIGLMP